MSEAYPNLNRAFQKFKLRPIPWYVKIALWFKPTYVAFDWESNDSYGTVLFYKYFRGRIYVVGEDMRPGSGVQ